MPCAADPVVKMKARGSVGEAPGSSSDPVVKKKARGYVGEAPSSSSGDRQLLRPKAAARA